MLVGTGTIELKPSFKHVTPAERISDFIIAALALGGFALIAFWGA